MKDTDKKYSGNSGGGGRAEIHVRAVELDAEGRRLLAAMPAGLKLAEVAAMHPWLINEAARQWMRPDRMKQFFEDILLDVRGNRSGFSEAVIHELMALHEHYLKIAGPSKGNVWDDAPDAFK